ncbi:MAG: ABC transporter permease [Blastocatellales bacterium]|nr:ABC transporter permease [Blastocatellales bacterium]
MEALLHDIRFALRVLVKNPGFTLVAAFALALGIGANTAIFSVVNGVLLRPLAYPKPEQLTMVWLDNRRQGIREDITSWPNYTDWRDQNQTFQGMAGYRSTRLNLTGSGEPEEMQVVMVTTNFFQLMGIGPALGRGFVDDESQPGKDNVVVLSHGLWQRRFGGDPAILNRQINLNGQATTVIGVMPAGFEFPSKTDMWGPLAPNDRLRAARGAFWLPVIGRLKDSVTIEQARAEMNVIAERLENEYPDINRGYGVNLVPLHETTVGNVRTALLVLLAAVGFVLLIACANVANLLLARAATRSREIAVRSALGAGRGRIIRQLLTESLILAITGGAVGVLLAWWGVDLLVKLGPENLPRLSEVRLDSRVLGFTFSLSILTGIVFGLAPAIYASRLDLSEMLKEGSRTGPGGKRANIVRSAFVVTELAFALLLLVGAGLMIRSFARIQNVDPGFRTDRLLTLQLRLPRTKYPDGAQVNAFYQQLHERLAALPGVDGASATTSILLPQLANSSGFVIEGRAPDPQEQRLELPFDSVMPEYFQVMGVPLLRGRFFTAQDGPDAPNVAIINETMAGKYFGSDDPLGRRFSFGTPRNDSDWITIVGVVRDTKRQGLAAPIRIESFMPAAQNPSRGMEIVIRTSGDPQAMAGTVREQVRQLDADLPIASIRTMEEIFSTSIAERRLNMLLLGIFAFVALVLAAVGIYGVMSYAISRRTNEMGVRIALGATRGDILRLVVGQGMRLALAGVGAGTVLAFVMTRWMSSLLFGISSTDLWTFTLVPVLLAATGLLACYIPARRATRVDPMIALRYE